MSSGEVQEMSAGDVTQLLDAWSRGDDAALSEMFPLVYDYLRRIAGSLCQNNVRNTVLQPTAMVHEAYLKLSAGDSKLIFKNRREFYGFSGRLMRFIIVEYIRLGNAKKRRGEGGPNLDVSEIELSDGKTMNPEQMLGLDRALRALEEVDPRSARIIEMKFYAGMNYQEIAETMDISTVTVKRELSSAKCFLYDNLKQ